MKIAICGSMSFCKEMKDVGDTLETMGHSISLPQNIHAYIDGTIDIENKVEKQTLDVIKKYFEEIKNSDAILVVNIDKKGIEMAFAHVLEKKVYLWNPIPTMGYSDEIEAMKPIVLNQDVSKIDRVLELRR